MNEGGLGLTRRESEADVAKAIGETPRTLPLAVYSFEHDSKTATIKFGVFISPLRQMCFSVFLLYHPPPLLLSLYFFLYLPILLSNFFLALNPFQIGSKF
jgi:hypothetical protein